METEFPQTETIGRSSTEASSTEASSTEASRETEFGLNRSAKSFRLVSSGLYKDGILAVVRETVHNARDAHASVGRADTPFAVHLPTIDAPFFAVRDYGPGISAERFVAIYATYFASTKDMKSTVEAGRLGLGSKAPFAYKDVFNVVSYQEGVKHTYTLFFDSHDEPRISPASTEPSDEPTGLEVHVGVNTNDINAFCQRATQVLSLLKVPPNLFGAATRPIEDDRILIDLEHIKIRDRPLDTPRLIMGEIAYPIDVKQFEPSRETRNFIRLPVDIHVGLSELSFVPSREDLLYSDPATSRRLNTVVSDGCVALSTYFRKLFSNYETEFAARNAYFNVAMDLGRIGSAVIGSAVVLWYPPDGSPPVRLVDSTMRVRPDPAYANIRIVRLERKAYNRGVTQTVLWPKNKFTLDVFCTNDLVFYINDEKRSCVTRAATHARWISGTSEKPTPAPSYYVDGPAEEVSAFRRLALRGAPVIMTSSIAPKRVERVRCKVKTLGVRAWLSGCLDNLVERSLDVELGGYYLITRHQQPDIDGWDMKRWMVFYAHCRKKTWFDPETTQLALIPSSIAKSSPFLKTKGWLPFVPAMQAKARDEYLGPGLLRAIRQHECLEAVRKTFIAPPRRVIDDMLRLAEALPETHALCKAVRLYTEWGPDAEKGAAASIAIRAMDIAVVLPSIDDEPGAAFARLRALYPLLDLLLGRSSIVDDLDLARRFDFQLLTYMGERDATVSAMRRDAPVTSAKRLPWRKRVSHNLDKSKRTS